MVQKRRHASQTGTHAQARRREDGAVDQTGQNSRLIAMHRLDMVPWRPSSVVSMASSEDGSLCTCLREDGRIDMYDTQRDVLLKSYPGNSNASPSSIVTLEEDTSRGRTIRMFVGGMDGTITEIDGHTRSTRVVCDSHGGAVWNMSLKSMGEGEEETASHVIAAACDDGCVRLYTVEKDVPGVSIRTSFLPVDGRALCVAWHPKENVVVSGGTDGCLHVWNAATGREMTRITVDGLSSSGEPPCIWSILVLSDGTIVSGDSLGQVSFWDGKFGTMLAKFNPNGADVLALASSPKGDVVFSSGVDPRIYVFKRISGGDGRTEWAYLSSKQEHALDVRALCCCSNPQEDAYDHRIFSAGNDSMIVSHSVDRFLKEHPRRVDVVPQRPCISVSGSEDLDIMATATANSLDIWKLQNSKDTVLSNKNDGDLCSPGKPPLHVAHMSVTSGAHITSVAVSSDARLVAFSDNNGIKCINIRDMSSHMATDGEMDASVVPILDDTSDPSTLLGIKSVALPAGMSTVHSVVHVEFVPNSHALIVCMADGTIKIIDSVLDADSSVNTIRDIHDMRFKTWFKKDTQKSSARRECPMMDVCRVSKEGEYVAVALRNRVFIISLKTRHIITQIPSFNMKPGSVIAGIEFLEKDTLIAIVTSKSETALFDVSTGDACALPGQDPTQQELHNLELETTVVGIAASPASSKSVIVYSANALCHVDFDRPLVNEAEASTKHGRRPRDKKAKLGFERATKHRNCRVLPCEHPLLYACSVHPNNLLVVQKPWESVWRATQSAPLAKHRYGT